MPNSTPRASLGWTLLCWVQLALYLTWQPCLQITTLFRDSIVTIKIIALFESGMYVGGGSRPLEGDCPRLFTKIVTYPINLHLAL